ncbi:MFS transporter [Phenylobacterium sp.]|uniref:MFS transporter n=1 Tax=Phenylobacterium sp. TaxID=1871053 RepID=UPI003BAA2D82
MSSVTASPPHPQNLLLAAVIVSLVDGVGLGIVLPHVPFFVLELGGSPAVVAQLVAVFMLSSFLAAPLIGHVSDRSGVRRALQLTFLGTLISYAGMMASTTLAMLFIFRAIGGAMSGREAILQALISAQSNQAQGVRHVGFVTAAALVGGAIGPLLAAIVGLFLDDPRQEITACLAVGMTLTTTAMWLTSRALPARPPGVAAAAPTLGMLANLEVVRALAYPILVRLGLNYGIGLALAVNAMFLHTRFGWRAENTAWLLAGTTLAGALGRAALAQSAIRRLGVTATLLIALGLASAAFLAMSLSQVAWAYAGFFGAYLLIHNIALICNIMQTSEAVSGANRGLGFGVVHAAGAVALAGSAIINGLLFQTVGPTAPYLAAAGVMGLTLILCAGFAFHRTLASSKTPQRPVAQPES